MGSACSHNARCCNGSERGRMGSNDGVMRLYRVRQTDALGPPPGVNERIGDEYAQKSSNPLERGGGGWVYCVSRRGEDPWGTRRPGNGCGGLMGCGGDRYRGGRGLGRPGRRALTPRTESSRLSILPVRNWRIRPTATWGIPTPARVGEDLEEGSTGERRTWTGDGTGGGERGCGRRSRAVCGGDPGDGPNQNDAQRRGVVGASPRVGRPAWGDPSAHEPERDRHNGGEFDPGSGSTLAACLMHASRTGWPSGHLRGGRVRTTWAICRLVGDSFRKREVIPHELADRVGLVRKGSSDSPDEEPAPD